MGIFKELIKDIKSQDTDTIQLIEDAADYVYNQHDTREHVEIRIISITNALTDEVVDKTSISKMIENTLIRKIQS